MSARRALPSLAARHAPLAAPAAQRAALAAVPLAREFDEALAAAGQWPLRPGRIDTLQLNLGKLCNQTCRHCHVDAGPDRREVMTRDTMLECLRALSRTDIPTVDLTGGAPEMNPHFRWLMHELRGMDRHVIDRCNLTILETAPHRDLVELFARERVGVVCSLPHYRALSTDRQRGDGVYERSIAALRRLNAVGYGDGQSGLRLVLVTNPVGAFLPANQPSLEAEWKRELERQHGVSGGTGSSTTATSTRCSSSAFPAPRLTSVTSTWACSPSATSGWTATALAAPRAKAHRAEE